MCTDLFRSRRKKICGGVGGQRSSRAAKMHERLLPIHLAVPILAVLGGVALAGDPAPVIQNGLPTTVVPVFQETGAPQFSYPAGSTSLGTGTGGGVGGTGNGGGGPDLGGAALNTMMATSWGQSASDVAQSMGVNPSALAATCVVESGCQNTPAGSTGSASGAFQMIDSTYSSMMAAAIASGAVSPDQVDTSLAGKMDPANEAIAASEYLVKAAGALQNAGVADPTVLDARSYYQFGNTNIATASDLATVSSVEPQLTASQLANNGLSANTTVGQWKQMQINKLGSTASQSVLSG